MSPVLSDISNVIISIVTVSIFVSLNKKPIQDPGPSFFVSHQFLSSFQSGFNVKQKVQMPGMIFLKLFAIILVILKA